MNHIDLEACRQVRELLPWHANGSLDAEQAICVSSHVEQCAACRREMEITMRIIESLPERDVAVDTTAPFSRLLHRINHQERRYQGWKMAAGLLLTLAAVAAVALPVYLFEPRFQAVTDPLPASAGVARLEVSFRGEENVAALTDLLERYNADVISGPSTDGRFTLEFRLPSGTDAAALGQRLEREPQVESVEWQPERQR